MEGEGEDVEGGGGRDRGHVEGGPGGGGRRGRVRGGGSPPVRCHVFPPRGEGDQCRRFNLVALRTRVF